jgi:hypothetical protein
MRQHALWGLTLIAMLVSGCTADERTNGSISPPAPPPTLVGIEDPRGDAGGPEDYLDVLSADVSKSRGAFEFSFTLAQAVPNAFDVPAEWDELFWTFCLDMNPRAPVGYPFASTTAVSCEFIVIARSTGGPITGVLIDRRPLVNVEDAITSSIPVVVRDAAIRATVPAARLGHPRELRWVMKTSEVTLPLGNDDFVDWDQVPDGRFARWPAPSA